MRQQSEEAEAFECVTIGFVFLVALMVFLFSFEGVREAWVAVQTIPYAAP